MKWFAVLAIVGLVPTIGRACEDENYCEDTPPIPEWIELRSTTIPSDGVLAIDVGEGSDETGWRLEVVVVDELGIAVPGRLETLHDFDVTTWRPDEAWRPGARYHVELSIVIVSDESQYANCHPPVSLVEVEIVAPRGTVDPPRYVVDDDYSVEPIDDLRALVCCDDARPHMEEPSDAGYGCPGPARIEHGAGFCTPAHGIGWLSVRYRIDPAEPESITGNLAVRLVLDHAALPDHRGVHSVGAAIREPTCMRFEVLDLARDELYSTEHCYEDSIEHPFGLIDMQPMIDLEANCADEPYVCAIGTDGWILGQCSKYVPPSSGSCSLGGRNAELGILGLAMLCLARRSRR